MSRHRFDALSLVFGLLFAALGVAALYDAIDFELLSLDWLWPAALIGSGIAVLLTLGSRQPTGDRAGTEPSGPTVDTTVHDGTDDLGTTER